jgi:hypothetical protein
MLIVDRRGAALRAGKTGLTQVACAGVALLLGAWAASPAAAEPCRFAPRAQINVDTGIEPQLLINGTCTDPVYNEDTFVITKTEQLTLQVPGGPLIPYTQVTGHFPATNTVETLPEGVRQSPTTFQQNYVFRFPAREFWRHRSFEQQHPSGGGEVDNEMAFTNGAFSINWMSASAANSVASHRHEAAATKVARAYARRLYDDRGRIYSYFWGCSGGGGVSVGAAENVRGVWDGIQAQCVGTTGDATYHSFYWQALYTMAIPQAKRDAIAAAAAPGGTGDIYAGLNEEETAVLNEFLAAGYPLEIIGNHFTQLTPLIDPIDIRLADPTYEDDFWSLPGYAGSNPPNYLRAALVDGYATITGITRDEAGAPIAVQFDPATLPAMGTTGANYLEYYVYGPNGTTRLIDPTRTFGPPPENKRRFSLQGTLDTTTGVLTLTGSNRDIFGGVTPITNSPVLLNALTVGSRIRVNNRFILAMYYYPRHSIIPGVRSHDQYRNADGSAIYPQRADNSVLRHANYRVMGGRTETGAINTRVMIITGMDDQLSWPIFNVGYAERVANTLGPRRANDMMRFYLHDHGSHSWGGGQPGIFRQSIIDLMAWAEQGVAPPPSTHYTVRNGQVVMPMAASERLGLQPVINLTANGGARATVGVNQPVNLVASIEMPPNMGEITEYHWTIGNENDDGTTILPTPQTQQNVNRTVSFDTPGTYRVRLWVKGQRDGLVDPSNHTELENFRDVRVVVHERW